MNLRDARILVHEKTCSGLSCTLRSLLNEMGAYKCSRLFPTPWSYLGPLFINFIKIKDVLSFISLRAKSLSRTKRMSFVHFLFPTRELSM